MSSSAVGPAGISVRALAASMSRVSGRLRDSFTVLPRGRALSRRPSRVKATPPPSSS